MTIDTILILNIIATALIWFGVGFNVGVYFQQRATSGWQRLCDDWKRAYFRLKEEVITND